MNGDFSVTIGVFTTQISPWNRQVSWIGDLCGQRVSGSESDGGGNGSGSFGGCRGGGRCWIPKSQVGWLVGEKHQSKGGGVDFMDFLGSNSKRKCFRTTPGLVEKIGERPGR